MNKDENLKVPYLKENIERCMCSVCPVQADSKCAQDKLESSKKMMADLSGNDVPAAGDVPGIYCSTGKATCQDLDPDKKCICNTCDVWKEYVLESSKPSMYFCKKGRAE
ncbi:MAG: DUF2769 domain-containing protein [Methanolobus sp.]|nr:DUF2769 domain-containing protein [Methanolobus sp.]